MINNWFRKANVLLGAKVSTPKPLLLEKQSQYNFQAAGLGCIYPSSYNRASGVRQGFLQLLHNHSNFI